MTTKTLTGIVLAAVQPARATETENLGICGLPPMPWNKGLVTGFALAFILVITLGGTLEVMGSERPRVEFSGPAVQVNTYDFAEIVIRVTDPDAANPFTDASVQGQVVHEGSAPVTVDGFCDSTDGSVFRIHAVTCRPTRTLDYLQTTGPGTDADGLVQRRGFRPQGHAPPRSGQSPAFHLGGHGRTLLLERHDDTYYLMGWDDETIRQSIDRLHRLKINRLRVLVYGRNEPRPWGQPVVPTKNFKLHLNPWPAERPDDIKNPGFDLKRFNVEHWRKYERLLVLPARGI